MRFFVAHPTPLASTNHVLKATRCREQSVCVISTMPCWWKRVFAHMPCYFMTFGKNLLTHLSLLLGHPWPWRSSRMPRPTKSRLFMYQKIIVLVFTLRTMCLFCSTLLSNTCVEGLTCWHRNSRVQFGSCWASIGFSWQTQGLGP